MVRTAAVRRKYLSLGLGEVAAAIAFAWLAVAVAPGLPDDRSRIGWFIAMAPLLLVLIQAGLYWLAARSWVGVSQMPAPMACCFAVFRWVDPLLLGGAAVTAAIVSGLRPALWLLYLLPLGFALGEYLNYYVVRLAYPATYWLTGVRQRRTPRLIEDVTAGLGRRQSPG